MLNKFKVKKVSDNITVGECLKYKREELGVSIRELAEKLKIRADYLENLEKNNYAGLPPDVYVRGFIRIYARFVGFDVEKMVRLYNRDLLAREKVIKTPKEKERKKKRKFTMSDYAIITPKIITAFFTFIIIILAGYYFWHQINSFNSTPYLFISNPSANQVVDVSQISIEGETEVGVVLRINGEGVFVDQNGRFKENVLLQPGRNILVVEAMNRFNKIAKEEINMIYEKKPEPVPVSEDKNGSNIQKDKDNVKSKNIKTTEPVSDSIPAGGVVPVAPANDVVDPAKNTINDQSGFIVPDNIEIIGP